MAAASAMAPGSGSASGRSPMCCKAHLLVRPPSAGAVGWLLGAAAGGLVRKPHAGAKVLAGGGPVRTTPRQQRRTRPAHGLVRRHLACSPHQVLPMDVQFDATVAGRKRRFLNVTDARSRWRLAIRVGSLCRVETMEQSWTISPALTSRQPSSAGMRGLASTASPEHNQRHGQRVHRAWIL